MWISGDFDRRWLIREGGVTLHSDASGCKPLQMGSGGPISLFPTSHRLSAAERWSLRPLLPLQVCRMLGRRPKPAKRGRSGEQIDCPTAAVPRVLPYARQVRTIVFGPVVHSFCERARRRERWLGAGRSEPKE